MKQKITQKNKGIISPYMQTKMTKTISLTIGERVAAIKIFDAFKGSLSQLVALIDDVKKFSVTTEEWTAAGLVKTKQADGSEQWKWEDKESKDIEVQQESIDYLVKAIKSKSESGDITIADIPLISLEGKLK